MDILSIAKAYNAFQQNVGQSEDSQIDQTIEKLFAPSFAKTANGAALVSKRSELKEQLLGVRQQSDGWTIDAKEILPLQDSQKSLIRYHLKSAKLGVFVIMALLQASSEGLIEEIDEVYYHIP